MKHQAGVPQKTHHASIVKKIHQQQKNNLTGKNPIPHFHIALLELESTRRPFSLLSRLLFSRIIFWQVRRIGRAVCFFFCTPDKFKPCALSTRIHFPATAVALHYTSLLW